ncbi:MAG: hypothetical protein VCC67_15290, partial [Myxococcota bacterium]
TDRHPDMIQIEQELGEVRLQLESREDADPDNTQAPTLAQQNAESQRERAALEVEMAVKEVERLRVSVADVEERLALTPEVAEALSQLENRLSMLAGNVELFSRRQLQAKVQVDMERRQLGEQFNILESAFPAPDPTSPNRLLIVVMGLIVGLAIGVGELSSPKRPTAPSGWCGTYRARFRSRCSRPSQKSYSSQIVPRCAASSSATRLPPPVSCCSVSLGER